MGQLIAAGVLAGLVNRTDEWGYRNPFALQWYTASRYSSVLIQRLTTTGCGR
jgi:hypothetical protein